MSIIRIIETIDFQLTELERLKVNYDPAAGLTVYVGECDTIKIQFNDALPILQAMLQSKLQSRKEMLALARIELKELQAFLDKEP